MAVEADGDNYVYESYTDVNPDAAPTTQAGIKNEEEKNDEQSARMRRGIEAKIEVNEREERDESRRRPNFYLFIQNHLRISKATGSTSPVSSHNYVAT